MAASLAQLVAKAQKKTAWELSNRTLYDLCRNNPRHENREEIVGKILMVGRVYAAAIERRRSKVETSDDFYISTVAPAIMKSRLDEWIAGAARCELDDNDALGTMADAHGRTTRLFQKITGLEKRSLASKYLHFHVPRLFFIYDTRAVSGLRAVSNVVGRASASESRKSSDATYWTFASKCLCLRRHVETEYGVTLAPRQLDNLLLLLHESR
jgi:hypothetical protein